MPATTRIPNAKARRTVTVPHGPIDSLFDELHASHQGLTAAEARRRLGEVGPNEPARAPRTAGLVQILLLLANPLVIILLIASLASALLGERVNASIIVLMVVLSDSRNARSAHCLQLPRSCSDPALHRPPRCLQHGTATSQSRSPGNT